MAQNYDIKQFSSEELKEEGKIVIPKYQRGLVWKIGKRKEFIDTIFKGNPFGVVLVYEKDDKYEVVDGLQRLSTMKAYMDNPLDFIGINDNIKGEEHLDPIIKKYIESNGKRANDKTINSTKKLLKKKMIAFVKEKGKPCDSEVWEYLSTEIGFNKDDFSSFRGFQSFYTEFLKQLKFPNILIPAIVYTGPYDNLPDVFQRLNTGSVKLTKYEIYASIWKDNLIAIKDQDMIGKVMSKYNNLETSSSFDVNVSEEDLANNGITFFEYCYSLSEILNDGDKNYSQLFPGEKKSTDPTGFEILALVCGLSVNKSNRLIETAYLGGKTPQFLVDLKNALVDCVSYLFSTLEEWITDIKGTVLKNESTYQIYHMIMSIFTNSYDLDLANGIINRKDEEKISNWRKLFKKYAKKHYLYDILTQFWSKNRQVTDLDNLIRRDNCLNKYTTNISRENFDEAINNYCDDLKQKATTRNIETESKLILNYYYRYLLKEDKNREKYFTNSQGIYFDIEHITPVLKFKENSLKLPISALGNLCYLPVKDNRSKRDKTIYQYSDDRPSLTFNQEFLNLIDYPSREDLEFLDYAEEDFKNKYIPLLEARESKLKKRLIDLMMDERLNQ